ncbi:branched-chain amino acid ABC transporter permease [Castellaniella caeni]|uniref:branched-chain amino acid ABC transporter permease n=1 Tax=Castellaniella caeni TaxID=266123 RepID=UPI00082B359F|nr:branched-chain amino acid ABC transporter permease [Castellaniella caeni]
MKNVNMPSLQVRAFAVLALVMIMVPAFASSEYILRVVALVWITAVAAVGLQILMGMAGQISLGHAGFFGIGAYVTAILPTRYGFPPIVAVLLGVLASMLVAWLIGKPILRLRGHYLAIATLGFSLLVGLVATGEAALTGGPDGMDVQPLQVGAFDLVSTRVWYWISCAVLLLCTWVATVLRHSPTGRALRAILGSEVAAASMGVDVARRKLQAFVIAATFAALAGSMLALMNGFITPDVVSFMMSVEFLAMVMIGGAASAFGAIVGAGLLTLMPQVLASFYDYQDAVIGLVIMLSMIFLRRGIVPTLSHYFSQRRR